MKTWKDLFDITKTPVENFQSLYEEAQKDQSMDATAMTLATIDPLGSPNARVVLLKKVDPMGFTFFTNYQSVKAKELEFKSQVCLVFYWLPLATQVRIWGQVKKVNREESELYFKGRPRLSQLGAWASHQSETLESYEELEKNLEYFTQKFKDQEVPCPEHWGGYRVEPDRAEFWFGVEGRLHHRYSYEKNLKGWNVSMKSP